MKIKVLASGSKGNSTYLEQDGTRLLIDLGINYRQLQNELEKINVTPSSIEGILLTHTHNDHMKGLASFLKKTERKVYVPIEIKEQIQDTIPEENIEVLEKISQIASFEIELIKTSHDAVGSVGYIIRTKDTKMVYITDTGYVNERYFKRLSNANIYIIESNHDEKMLMEGPYPYYLKQRVLGDTGHLSNHTTATYLSKWIGENTKYIVLAHLSENNNTEEIAYQAVYEELKKNDKVRPIIIAKQYESLEVIEV